jgi:hypothetical protein
MKTIKYFLTFLVTLVLFSSCETENYEFGDIIAPTNLTITPDIVGKSPVKPFGDGSGVVNITATANDAISYKFIHNGVETVKASGQLTYNFGNTGTNKYIITVVASGKAGVTTSSTIEIEVSVVYVPPADLVTSLTGNSSRIWRIKAEAKNHFGLGPVGGSIQTEWYGAGPLDKADTGMYDDRFTFKTDGSFSHNVGADKWVFGRKVLIEELNGPGGVAVGDDIIQYPYTNNAGQYTLTAPSGVETLSLSGKGFIGYYIGGTHKYRIFKRSANEMVLSSADGNNGFEWWFTIVPE